MSVVCGLVAVESNKCYHLYLEPCTGLYLDFNPCKGNNMVLFLSRNVLRNVEIFRTIRGGSRIFEKGGRGNGKVTLELLRLNINV